MIKRRKDVRKEEVCQFCASKDARIDYKTLQRFQKYVTERGKILPRRISGTCAKHQRELTVAIKRARNVAPFTIHFRLIEVSLPLKYQGRLS